MYDPDVNIEASTVLLSRLRDRIEKPTPEKIGTLWNSLKEGSFSRLTGRDRSWYGLLLISENIGEGPTDHGPSRTRQTLCGRG